MALTAAERMKLSRDRRKKDYTRLDIMLLNKDAETLAKVTKEKDITKAEFVTALLNGNAVTNSNSVTLGFLNENKELKKQVNHQNQLIYELNKQPLAKKNNDLTIETNNAVKELEQYKEANIKLVLQRDRALQQAIKLEGNISILKADNKGLERSLKDQMDKEFNCMIITKAGTRCKSNGLYKAEWHGIEIRVCGQHNAIINTQ